MHRLSWPADLETLSATTRGTRSRSAELPSAVRGLMNFALPEMPMMHLADGRMRRLECLRR